MDKTVFISGSRQIRNLPAEAQDRLGNIIAQELEVILGDSDKGVDKMVADCLRKEAYSNVRIFSIHSSSRIKNLPEEWVFQTVSTDTSKKFDKNGKITNGRELETAKDRRMGELCDYGLVVWQATYVNHRFGNESVSSGSLRNMVQLLLSNKPVLLYYKKDCDDFVELDFDCCELRKIEELQEVVKGLESELVEKRYKRILKDEERQRGEQQQLGFD